jgi:hypothetical protein
MAYQRGHEGMNQFSTLPEALPDPIPEPATIPYQPNYAAKDASLPIVVPLSASHAPSPPWWKRPKVLLTILGVTILVMGAIIGTVVGVLVSREKS